MSNHVLESFEYGKSLVRLLRVVRDPKDRNYQTVIEYTVQSLLTGPRLDTSYSKGDNELVVATDSQKNTIHYFAKTLPGEIVLSPEHFGLYLANHFPSKYPHITSCSIDILAHKWSRIVTSDGKPHPHSFVRDGEDKRVVSIKTEKLNGQENGPVVLRSLKGGLKDLLVLKSSGSAFHSFLRDEFTTLKEVNDRIFSTSVDCQYSIALPKDESLASLLKSPSALPNFEAIAKSVRDHTIDTFAKHSGASVQQTLYLMCNNILNDATDMPVQDVEYALPNKHYVPINLDWAKLSNLSGTDAEVFLPQADPSGLIKAKVRRASKL
ncbi:unnamed protein product [Sympodiomycopsis kandeliae]